MTHRELKELLDQIPEKYLDNNIAFQYKVGCCGDVEYFDDIIGQVYSMIGYTNLSLTFCDGIAGHETCSQSAATNKKSKELYGKSDV